MGTHRTISSDRDLLHLFGEISVSEEQVRSSQSEEKYLWMRTHWTFSSDRLPQSEERYLWIGTYRIFSSDRVPLHVFGKFGKMFLHISFTFLHILFIFLHFCFIFLHSSFTFLHIFQIFLHFSSIFLHIFFI